MCTAGSFIWRRRGGAGGPYYIRFEPPSNCGKRIRTVHRSLRTNVIAAAKARAKLIIEPILNGQWEAAEKLKSRTGYATNRRFNPALSIKC
ncbi:MAG: hypothetical protein DMF16_02055 [Verrucomicrobia bacterium]|nr:MAG: hypothetical protein DMF16_02055 [Verrucomicrobiota bacterium]